MRLVDPDQYDPVSIHDSSTSYFSEPESGLDPSIFEGVRMRPHVRHWILSTVLSFLSDSYTHPETWMSIWVAGSGVSYQWAADRDPGDLDVMLGIDYVEFRHANPAYSGLSDSDVSTMLNQKMFAELYPELDGVSFGGSNFEVTVYVNAGVSADRDGILFIRPYAAYDVARDEWAVAPDPHPMVRVHPSWHVSVETDRARGQNIVDHYGRALMEIRNSSNPAHRVNAEHNFGIALDAASALYDEIHAGRRAAFGPAGLGYADYSNYRWQSGKQSGVVQTMRRLKDYQTSSKNRDDFETYGMELPDTDTLIRRASTYRQPD